MNAHEKLAEAIEELVDAKVDQMKGLDTNGAALREAKLLVIEAASNLLPKLLSVSEAEGLMKEAAQLVASGELKGEATFTLRIRASLNGFVDKVHLVSRTVEAVKSLPGILAVEVRL